MKTIFNTMLFILVLAVFTAQADIVFRDLGTNKLVASWKREYPDQMHFLESADEFTLYSLDPIGEGHYGTNTFWFHKILGQINIEQGAERTNLVMALSDGIAEGVPSADCFQPRHGIRATKNGVAMDFLICFECQAVQVFSSKGTNWGYSVSGTPAALFNKTLKKAGVPLPKN